MSVIKKKINPQYFILVKSGQKKFELRLADFKIKAGDTLVLQEWNPRTKKYTGRELRKKANFVLRFKLNDFGQGKKIQRKGLYIIQFK